VASKGKYYACFLKDPKVFPLTAAEIPEYKRCWEIRDKTNAAQRAAYAAIKIRALQSMDLEIADDPALEEKFPHVASYSKASLSSRRADVSVIDGMSYDERIACIAVYEEKLTQLFLFRNKEVEVSEARAKELERAALMDIKSAGDAGSQKRKDFVDAAATKIPSPSILSAYTPLTRRATASVVCVCRGGGNRRDTRCCARSTVSVRSNRRALLHA
jgi:hypothetical protein